MCETFFCLNKQTSKHEKKYIQMCVFSCELLNKQKTHSPY